MFEMLMLEDSWQIINYFFSCWLIRNDEVNVQKSISLWPTFAVVKMIFLSLQFISQFSNSTNLSAIFSSFSIIAAQNVMDDIFISLLIRCR